MKDALLRAASSVPPQPLCAVTVKMHKSPFAGTESFVPAFTCVRKVSALGANFPDKASTSRISPASFAKLPFSPCSSATVSPASFVSVPPAPVRSQEINISSLPVSLEEAVLAVPEPSSISCLPPVPPDSCSCLSFSFPASERDASEPEAVYRAVFPTGISCADTGNTCPVLPKATAAASHTAASCLARFFIACMLSSPLIFEFLTKRLTKTFHPALLPDMKIIALASPHYNISSSPILLVFLQNLYFFRSFFREFSPVLG